MLLLRFLFLVFCFLLPLAFNLQNGDSPFEFFKIVFSGIFGSTLSFVFLLYLFRSKKFRFELSTGLIVVLLIAAANLVSYIFSINPYLSMWGDNLLPSDSLASVLIFTALAFIAGYIFDHQSRKWLVAVLLLALTAQAGYGFLQSLGYDFYHWNYAKPVFGTLGSTVAYSTFLGCLIPVAISCFFVTSSLYLKAFLFFLILLSNYVLLETGSRTPAAVNLIIQCGLILYFIKKRNLFKPLSSSLALLVAVFSLYGLAFLKPAEKETLGYKFNPAQVAIGAQDRILLWRDAVAAWKVHPFLGYGPETFQIAQRAYHSVEMNQYERWHSVWVKAHNHLIQHLVSTGVVGLLMHLLLFGFAVRRLIKIWRIDRPEADDVWALGFGGGFVFLFLANLTAFNFVATQFFYFLFPVLLSQGPDGPKQVVDFTKIAKAFRLLLVALAGLFLLFGVKFYNHFRGDVFYQLSYKALNENKDIKVASLLADEALKANDQEPAYYCHMSEVETKMQLASTSAPEQHKSLILDSLNYHTENCKEKAVNRDHFFLQVANQYSQLFFGGIIPSPEKSLENYEALMVLAPNVPLAYYRSALVYLKTGNETAFEENMEKALELKSNYLPAYLELFKLYYRVQDAEKKSRLLVGFSAIKHKPTELPELCKVLADLAAKNNDSEAEKIFLQKDAEFTSLL